MYSKDCFQFVPWFDYSNNDIINWEQSTDGINNSLVKYFGLTNEEISYVDNQIKPMD